MVNEDIANRAMTSMTVADAGLRQLGDVVDVLHYRDGGRVRCLRYADRAGSQPGWSDGHVVIVTGAS